MPQLPCSRVCQRQPAPFLGCRLSVTLISLLTHVQICPNAQAQKLGRNESLAAQARIQIYGSPLH